MEMVIRSILAAAGLCLVSTALIAADHGGAPMPGVQSLDVYRSGERVHVLTGELHSVGTRPVLMHRASNDGGATWSEASEVGTRMPEPFGLRRGMDAQIAAHGTKLIAAWTTHGTDRWGSGPIATAISDDRGVTWRPGPDPADDGSTTGHGFIDICADQAGTFHLTWLDSRDGRQGLRYANSADGGASWSRNATIKAASCECCANAFATGAGGELAILFRDGDPRDMRVARSADSGGTWSIDAKAGPFDWKFNGCPHVGGGIGYSKSDLHVVVWTGDADRNGIYHASSAIGGATWSAPRQLGNPGATHPDLAIGGDGRICVAWNEASANGWAVFVANSADGGKNWSAPERCSAESANADHPRVLAVPEGFRVIWTEVAGEARVMKSALVFKP